MSSKEADDAKQFSSCGARLIFDGVPWKDWEVAGVKALQEQEDLGPAGTWAEGDLLRFLHLAVAYRNNGNSGTDFTDEDVVSAKDLLLKSQEWRKTNKPTWTLEIRNAFKDMVFMHGRDKRGRPVGVIRPLESSRELWSGHSDDLAKCIFALCEEEINDAFLPGVAEQATWIIDLYALGISDIAELVPPLQALVAELTDNFPSRAGTFFVLNAGWGLAAAVNGVLLFVQAETQEKAQVFTGNFGEYAAEHFDLATLPIEFGGEGVRLDP